MASLKTARGPIGRLPARRPATRRIVRRRRIQAEPSNHGKGVTVPRVDGDPFPRAAVPVDPKFLRVHRNVNKAGAGQRVGNRPGTVVGGIVEGFMATAKSIRLGPQLVGRPDRAFYRHWGVRRRERHFAIQLRLVSGSRGTGGRKRARKTGGRDETEDGGTNKEISDKDSHRIVKLSGWYASGLSAKNRSARQAQFLSQPPHGVGFGGGLRLRERA